ncbi:hypothetical protein OCAR_5952 [Afipia carboxidovorans OM5]|nr:hypothetical protein OCAR_5952 [Afipia carboxidovorans OM5]
MDKSGRRHPGRLSRWEIFGSRTPVWRSEASFRTPLTRATQLTSRCRPRPALSMCNRTSGGAIIPFPSLLARPPSELRNEVRPHRYSPNEQHERGQSGGFLNERLQHDRLLLLTRFEAFSAKEHIQNNVRYLFYRQAQADRPAGRWQTVLTKV